MCWHDPRARAVAEPGFEIQEEYGIWGGQEAEGDSYRLCTNIASGRRLRALRAATCLPSPNVGHWFYSTRHERAELLNAPPPGKVYAWLGNGPPAHLAPCDLAYSEIRIGIGVEI